MEQSMYYSFNGTITVKGNDFICIEVAGIEWQLGVSLNTLASLTVGQQAKIYSHLNHTEVGMTLYGFASLEEKNLFLNLIKVSGIGPRVAVRMLGGSSPAELVEALEKDDVALFSRLPGIGKATAQKVILTLKGKLTNLEGNNNGDELVESLVAMGYDKKATTKVVAALRQELGNSVAEGVLIKAAIVRLS
jgi:Holliday junction DNA helicase RuvA